MAYKIIIGMGVATAILSGLALIYLYQDNFWHGVKLGVGLSFTLASLVFFFAYGLQNDNCAIWSWQECMSGVFENVDEGNADPKLDIYKNAITSLVKSDDKCTDENRKESMNTFLEGLQYYVPLKN